jgi:aldehyde dehydrogenase (NAD+)
VYEDVKQRLVKAYGQLRIGNPLEEKNHVGPVIDQAAVAGYQSALVSDQGAGRTVAH